MDVIYPPLMRACAKIGCAETPIATVGLRYDERIVVVGPLLSEADPNLLELCRRHSDRLTPPVGWQRLDLTPASGPIPASSAEQLTA
jgi:hypothetical protein